MTYIYTGGWSPHTGFNAPLYGLSGGFGSGDESMQYWASFGIDAEKLVLGLAFYSRRFTSVDTQNDGLQQSFSDERGWYGYRYIESEILTGSDFEQHRHETANVPWIYSPEENVFITYDDPESIALKAEYSVTNDYGGVVCWELSQNRNNELVDVIDRNT